MDEPKYEMNIQGPVQGTIQGEQHIITQYFYDQTGRDWNVRLPLVRDLRAESFKLGDTVAARFPYVTAPIQGIYTQAVQALQSAGERPDAAKRGILLFGESNAGKTRLALEALGSTLAGWPVLRWQLDYTKDDIPPVELLKDKHIVLFLDDLQDYTTFRIKDPLDQTLIVDPRTTTLRTLVETLLQITQNTVIVATCRIESKSQTQATLGWLLVHLTNIPRIAQRAC